MNTLPFVTVNAMLALAALAILAPSRAGAANAGPTETHTIGTTVRPDPTPADPHAARLPRWGSGHSAGALAAQAEEKPAALETHAAIAVSALSPAQRAKRADVAALAAAPAPPVEPASKPAALSTVGAVTGSAPHDAPEDLIRRKQAASIARAKLQTAPAAGTRPLSTFGALGVIPRPEWSAGLAAKKPSDFTTAEPSSGRTAAAPAPDATGLQRRAARTAPAAAGAKPAPVSTSLPRDPAAPAAATQKSAPANATPEVR